MKTLRFASALCCLLLAACQSTIPTIADMDRFYREAERRSQERVTWWSNKHDRGEMTDEAYQAKLKEIQDDIPRVANDLAMTRHQMAESERKALGIPTSGSGEGIAPPGRGSGGDTFYRQAGSVGSPYQGTGAGAMRYQPGSTVDALRQSSPF